MKTHKIVALRAGCFLGFEIGHPTTGYEEELWVGKEVSGGFQFFPKGHYFGEYCIPDWLKAGDTIVAGVKNNPQARVYWNVIDFDEQYLVLTEGKKDV